MYNLGVPSIPFRDIVETVIGKQLTTLENKEHFKFKLFKHNS